MGLLTEDVAVWLYLHPGLRGRLQAVFMPAIPAAFSTCCAVYRRTYRRVMQQNHKFYQRFPMDVENVQARAASQQQHVGG